MSLILTVKPFSFHLVKPIKTASGVLQDKKGWLIHLEDQYGNYGWGEISPLNESEFQDCKSILTSIKTITSHQSLNNLIPKWPKSLAFGIGGALAELDGIIGERSEHKWLNPPQSALLLPLDEYLIPVVENYIRDFKQKNLPLTIKLKVAVKLDIIERKALSELLNVLPNNVRLRLDANAGWNREQANRWADFLKNEPRIEWLEQPLPANDLDGLSELSKKMPIALDESLIIYPSLVNTWESWQIRRPSLEGDPRLLLKEFKQSTRYKVIATTFETGIGSRWIHHLAALQKEGDTPTAPGLAPGWSPTSLLFSKDPQQVWISV